MRTKFRNCTDDDETGFPLPETQANMMLYVLEGCNEHGMSDFSNCRNGAN
jgi:hypothetical protein